MFYERNLKSVIVLNSVNIFGINVRTLHVKPFASMQVSSNAAWNITSGTVTEFTRASASMGA